MFLQRVNVVQFALIQLLFHIASRIHISKGQNDGIMCKYIKLEYVYDDILRQYTNSEYVYDGINGKWTNSEYVRWEN